MDERGHGDAEAGFDLLLRLGRALHEAGFPTPQLEEALTRVAARLGVEAQFFSTPTSLFFAFGGGLAQRTHLERVEPAGVDLGRLEALHGLIERVADGAVDAPRALAELDEIRARPRRYPAWLTHLSWGLASASTAIFLGGGWNEVAVGGAIGLVTGLLARLLERRRESGFLFEPVAAASAALLAAAAATFIAPLSIYIATLAGIIYLIPGFTLTVAMTELATRHLSAGTARFAAAIVVFLTVTFGTALGSRLAEVLFGPIEGALPRVTSGWPDALALVVAPLALSVLFRAPLREAPWIVAIGIIGFQGARLGSMLLSPELGALLGAVAVGLASRVYELRTGRPETIPLVPAILLLVPGSIGYRSFASLLERDVVLGVETAFRMFFVAMSLVAGLLLANAVAPRRRRPAA
jgi:uncharacterized membrane protein YjjP (DUF1212 family)